MRLTLKLAVALAAALLPAMAHAEEAAVESDCGVVSFTAGKTNLLTQTPDGYLCTKSGLPSGGATATKQDTGNASMSSIDTKLGEVQASPTANTALDRLKALKTSVDALKASVDAFSAAAATASKQDTLNTSVTETHAAAGSNASKAEGVQGLDGGKPVLTRTSSTGNPNPTYVYTTNGYAAYATPTDMVGICGSASKTVIILNLWMGINSSSAALQTIHFVKRSTADTGGTDGAPAALQNDSADAAPTATLHSYTVSAPTLGTTVGDMRLQSVASTVVTSAPGTVSVLAPINVNGNTNNIVLRGTGECLYLNYAGAALTSGFTAVWGAQWSEVTPGS
jgi:hypothetical protein